ncbi:Cation/H+ exchanger [Roridomyces roridus]|uniref:Cation/H+ exchanger n=1 Tax=Roridomyces roridus TaxID=1738132 RepID=A0AAD7BRK5_9AGAR|nr:Cation/H+ exchanger [Roridomyces roridus]
MPDTAYTTPGIPLLLSVSSFLVLINIAEHLFARYIHVGLLGPLCIGIVFGPQASGLLPEDVQSTFIVLGYIGLLLIIFEAGLSTNVALLFDNILLSCVVALSGMLMPIALSMLLLHFGYGYTKLQSFAAGASLSSTSLGTALTMLKPEYRDTRTGTVLMAAALLDDIGGLVIAAILSQLSSHGSSSSAIPWYIIVRPILVSFGFAFGVPVLAVMTRWTLQRWASTRKSILSTSNGQLLLMVVLLSGFVAGAEYAGTSQLFGAYLAGAFLAYAFALDQDPTPAPLLAFQRHLTPILQTFFSPLFFASIGFALPIRSLGSVDGSSRVVWRGLVYSVLMGVAKFVVGLWMLVWPDSSSGRGWFGRSRGAASAGTEEPMDDASQSSPIPPSLDFTPIRSATLIGLAMIARGEIALIVAEISRPLLGITAPESSSEPFAIVIWATLLNTAAGAVLVGFLMRGDKAVDE